MRYRVYIEGETVAASRRFAGRGVFLCEDVLVMDNTDSVAILGMIENSQVALAVMVGDHENQYEDLEMDYVDSVAIYDVWLGKLEIYRMPFPNPADEQAA